LKETVQRTEMYHVSCNVSRSIGVAAT